MRPSPPEPPRAAAPTADGRVTVEAATAEQAIARVHDRLGVDAQIVQAEKVLRGGLWGFFPKQVVQLTARPATSPPPPSEPQGLDAVLTRLASQEDDAEEGLGAALRRHLGVQIDEDAPAAPDTPPPAPVPGPTPPSPTAGLPLEDVEYARVHGAPWSGRGLLALGLPRGLVEAVLAQEPADDAAWTYALARSLTPLCRPLPAGAAALAGPRAEKLSRALGTPLVRLSGTPRGRSTFAVACTDSDRARSWLAAHRGQRWLHLVIGGSDWRGLLFEGPLAVSWVGDDALGDAIRTAHDLGMVLGPGVRSDAAGTLVEPVPIELAMLLRDRLGGDR